MTSLTLSTNKADWLMCIISAVIAVLTYILEANVELTASVIIGATIVFLTALIDINKTNNTKQTSNET